MPTFATGFDAVDSRSVASQFDTNFDAEALCTGVRLLSIRVAQVGWGARASHPDPGPYYLFGIADAADQARV